MRLMVRPIYVVLYCLLLAGCQTASLEDAAPKTVAAAGAGDTAGQPVADTSAAVSGDDIEPGKQSRTIARNPGFVSVVPIERTAPAQNKAFVDSGASRTGEFPTFGQQPKAANSQFSEQDKLEAEAEMTELLRNRASTPDARAQYEARLRELRALAARHGSDTQREIEN
ncbi:hypothetical protein SAMN05877838_0079 [Hoeflea halophila]|uniref:Beta-barrel assembly complex subunit BamF n=1 Tax=Hoeflea halophila TaxID=714899 RepID=A0A286HKN2_9HYPH|nr:hypothetical protein [Hoeflea halophila]SOE08365.1 hypothetical protein SAMN05877838_0079 [Hoeflea halophila]